MAKDNETKQKFIELRASGLSFDKISKDIDVSKPTLIKWNNEFDKQISELQFIEFEALAEQHGLTKKARVERLAADLENIEAELTKRGFDKVGTDKLLDIKYKLTDRLREEFGAIRHTEGGLDLSNDFGYTVSID